MPAPFTSEGNRSMLTKIIVIYTVFYFVMKWVAIFQGAWFLANLLLCVPFILLGVWGGILIKRKMTNWLFVIVAILIISAVRYYEAETMLWLHGKL